MSTSSESSYSPPASIPDYLIRHATLRQLQVFESIVRLGSFTRAAEELFLTQPTVSMQVKKLAEVMGLPLFEHIGRNVQPTEAGRELFAACRDIFTTLSNLEMKLADLKGLKRGRLRLCVISTAKYFTPEILGEFSKLYPGIELVLKVTNRDRVIERMIANEDDLYIVGMVPDSGIEIETFAFSPNPMVVIAPRNHPLVGKKKITLEELSREPFILREPGSGIRDLTIRIFREKGLHPNVRMELGSNEAIKHAVVADLGVSVLSLHTLTLEGVNGPVAILDVENFPLIRQWYMMHPKGKELSLVARTFLDFVIENEPRFREKMQIMWPQLGKLMEKPVAARLPGKKSKKRKAAGKASPAANK